MTVEKKWTFLNTRNIYSIVVIAIIIISWTVCHFRNYIVQLAVYCSWVRPDTHFRCYNEICKEFLFFPNTQLSSSKKMCNVQNKLTFPVICFDCTLSCWHYCRRCLTFYLVWLQCHIRRCCLWDCRHNFYGRTTSVQWKKWSTQH